MPGIEQEEREVRHGHPRAFSLSSSDIQAELDSANRQLGEARGALRRAETAVAESQKEYDRVMAKAPIADNPPGTLLSFANYSRRFVDSHGLRIVTLDAHRAQLADCERRVARAEAALADAQAPAGG